MVLKEEMNIIIGHVNMFLCNKIQLSVFMNLVLGISALTGISGEENSSFEPSVAKYFQAKRLVFHGPENWTYAHCQIKTLNLNGLGVTFSNTESSLIQVLDNDRNVSTLVVMYGPQPERFDNMMPHYPGLTWMVPDHTMGATEVSDYDLRLDSRMFSYSQQENDTNNVSIFEYYAIKSGPVIKQLVGYWVEAKGLEILEPNMYERRSNLRGVELSNVVLEWAPFNVENKDQSWRGLGVDLVKLLGAATNSKVIVVAYKCQRQLNKQKRLFDSRLKLLNPYLMNGRLNFPIAHMEGCLA